MNFFKSSFFSDFKLPEVLSPPQEESEKDQPGVGDANASQARKDADTSQSSSGHEEQAGAWGFGSLVKSLTLKSEEMLQAYRKDLEEFGTGLKMETQLIAEVAAHAVKDLPTSLETGASVAQESLESVGQVIEDFSSSVWRGTAEIITQGKEAVLRGDDDSEVPAIAASASSFTRYDNVPIITGRYSRFEAQVRAMQHDSSTYCDEPEDTGDYSAWKSSFDLQNKWPEIKSLLKENTFCQELFTRFVPAVICEEVFWTRYFYRLHKLRQTEEARADLVKRAKALEEEDLSWDTEDESEGEVQSDNRGIQKKTPNLEEGITKAEDVNLENERSETKTKSADMSTGTSDANEKGNVDSKGVVQGSAEEEDDLGWEVAEDVESSSSNDGKKSSNSEASWEVPDVPREAIRRRFTAQEEEDLSWDVDDADDDTRG